MKRVIVGISGGVDSSVSAVLLKKQGYEVVGITFIFTDGFDTTDAISVCDKLGIEHHIIDYRTEFKEMVIDCFINDYKNGITPNPCVLCNKEVKFRFLYEKMLEYNCDYIATGHYAKITDGKLYKSQDLNKDQTYFLAQLSNQQLSKLLLPLEGITKDEVRKIALENDLINANKKDSTDVCFIEGSFKDYISNKIASKSGNVIDVSTKRIVGIHNGLNQYTIGQRKGLNLGGNDERLFVVGKNLKDNILYVASGTNNEYLLSDSCIIENVNFNIIERPNKCTAKFRYRSSEVPVTLVYLDNGSILLKYDDVKTVTPGQACVLYDGNQCIGGGIIKTVCKNQEKIWYIL